MACHAKKIQNLKKRLNSCFVKKWIDSRILLIVIFWITSFGTRYKKVHKGHHCKPFRSIQELKEKTIEVWDEGATDLHTIRKVLEQFLPHLCQSVNKSVD